MSRSLEERATGLLSRDSSWGKLQMRAGTDDTWPSFRTRVPPDMYELMESHISSGVGPRSRQEIFLAAMRLYMEAVQPESTDDDPVVGIEYVDFNRRRLRI